MAGTFPQSIAAGDREPVAARIEQRTRQLLRLAAPLCAARRVAVPDPIIRLDLRGQAAGQARWRQGARPLLRFNRKIAQRHMADFLARTVTHEVAHLITFACHGGARPHGPEWRAVMTYLGVDDADRCHAYPLDRIEVRRQRRWSYQCDCSDHELSTTRHNRVMSGTRYHCRQCHAVLQPADTPAE